MGSSNSIVEETTDDGADSTKKKKKKKKKKKSKSETKPEDVEDSGEKATQDEDEDEGARSTANPTNHSAEVAADPVPTTSTEDSTEVTKSVKTGSADGEPESSSRVPAEDSNGDVSAAAESNN